MFNSPSSTIADQKGSVLVITLLVILALTAIGITAIRTSSLDVKIAANDKFHKMTFYAADGGAQMTTELIEQNIEERGFGEGPVMREDVKVITGDFYLNEEDTMMCSNNDPSETNRDIEAPDMGQGTVYIKAYGNTKLSTGSALQISAGDKGRGKGLSGGGAQIVYDIRGFGKGLSNSESRVLVRWVHLL